MKYYFLFLLVWLSCLTNAQNIKGIVYGPDGLPIPGALVYLDGTTINTYTLTDGTFEIQTKSSIYANLVVSSLGYETISIRKPFEDSFHHITLKPKVNQLNEILVSKNKKKFKREDKLKVFREEFLGKTISGKYCKITNESDLVLTYNIKKKRLTATSDQPIRIHNVFLGYELEYYIKECYIDFDWVTIKSGGVSGWKFSGTTHFKDLTNDSTSYAAKRKMSYTASQMEFFRNLSRHTLGRNNFSLWHGNNYCDPDKYFKIIPRGNEYIVLVNNEHIKRKENFYQSFVLEYPDKSESEVIFLTNVFRLDQFGNYNTFNSISFTGEISNKRIGDLLPLDYNLK